MVARWLPVAAFAAQVQAYAIDASCSANTNAFNLVSTAIPSAFGMVQSAVDALNNPNAAVTNLMNALWAPGGTNVITPTEAILSRFSGVPVTTGPTPYLQFYYSPGVIAMPQPIRGLLSMNGLAVNDRAPTGGTSVPGTDVIFYCDTSRYTDITEPDGTPRIKDMDIIEVLPVGVDDPRSTCTAALAFTDVSNDASKPSQITLCPWFIQWAGSLKNPTTSNWGVIMAAALAKPAIQLATRVWPYTIMDLLSLFDKVVVHELTHTRHGGKTFDCTLDGSDNPGFFYFNTAYGWKAATSIAGKTPDTVGTWTLEGLPINNADSYGLFASGVRVINAGGTINANGGVTGPTGNNNKKRGLNSTEGMAWEPIFDLPDGQEPMELWSKEFNSTLFAAMESQMTEGQKVALVGALLGDIGGTQSHVYGNGHTLTHAHRHSPGEEN